jgi:FkbM family methyltransferase
MRPATIVNTLRVVENWPEVVSVKLGRGTRELSLISLRNGIEIACRRGSRDWDVVREVFVRGGYGRSAAYLQELRTEATVLDLGGNIGCFSLLAASRSPFASVVAYEPGPPNIRMFRLNCLANPELSSRIHLEPFAIAGVAGESFWQFDMSNAGGSSIYGDVAGGEQVRIRAFAEVVADLDGPIALAKIDIEGAEYELFEHTASTVWQRIPALSIEIHRDPGGRRSQEQLLSSIRSLGYLAEADDRFAWFCYR